MYSCICTACHKPKWVKYKIYKRNCLEHNYKNKQEFDKHYVCGACTRTREKSRSKYHLYRTYEYKQIKKLLQEQVDIVIERGVNDPAVQHNFAQSVKNILDTNHIKIYTFHIVDGILKGIYTHQIPFYNDVYIELKSKGTKNG